MRRSAWLTVSTFAARSLPLIVIALAGGAPAVAQQPAPGPEEALVADEVMNPERDVAVHAFVSQGAILTTANNFLAKSERGSFEFLEAGVNITKTLGDRLRVGIQLFARDLGPVGDYKAKMDWLYLDYRLADWLGLRAGRVKIPFGLYNEINDVDSARVPVLLPQSIYPIENRDILLSQTGLELYGYLRLGAAGALDYRLYGGTIYVDGGGSAGGVTISPIRVPYVAGGRLVWETALEGLRAAGSVQTVRLDFDVSVGPLKTTVEFPVKLWVASLEYAPGDLFLATEYGRWYGEINSTNPMIIPESETTNERFFTMASYRLAPWFCPGLYYAVLYPNVDDRKGRDAWQHDLAATLRFDITRSWLVKLEGHYMKGTAYLNEGLNDDKKLKDLTKTWGLFLLKTTVYF